MTCRNIKVMTTLFLWFCCVSKKMNTRRTLARRVKENDVEEEIPPQVEQVPQDGQGVQGAQVPPQGDDIPNVEGGNEVPVVHSDLLIKI